METKTSQLYSFKKLYRVYSIKLMLAINNFYMFFDFIDFADNASKVTIGFGYQ